MLLICRSSRRKLKRSASFAGFPKMSNFRQILTNKIKHKFPLFDYYQAASQCQNSNLTPEKRKTHCLTNCGTRNSKAEIIKTI